MANRLLTITTLLLTTFIMFSFLSPKDHSNNSPATSIYDVKINSISNEPINFGKYRGKKILIVNVASKCGYTHQYKNLQTLYEQYEEKLVIIGVPCNQFMNQEPGTPEEIVTFCEMNYGVTFPITEKVNVKDHEIHELYQWLTQKEKNGSRDSNVRWNFQKYLINEQGELQEIFATSIDPLDKSIIDALK